MFLFIHAIHAFWGLFLAITTFHAFTEVGGRIYRVPGPGFRLSGFRIGGRHLIGFEKRGADISFSASEKEASTFFCFLKGGARVLSDFFWGEGQGYFLRE